MRGRFDRSRANAINPNFLLGGGPKLWLNGSDRASLTVDTDGSITSWADRSGNGYDFAQATLANRPYLTRADNLENRIKYSEDMSQAAIWSKGETTVSANATSAPNGTTTADKLQETDPTADHNITQNHEVVKGVSYTYSVYAKKAERNYIRLRPSNDGFPDSHYAFFNLDTGAVGSVVGAGITAAIESAGDGWYKCSVAITADASHASAYVQISISTDGSTLNYDGTVGSGVYLWGAHFARTGKGYVQTTTFPQYAGLNGRAVPYFPGAASYMSRAFTAALDVGVGDNSLFAVSQIDGGADATGYAFMANETSSSKGFKWQILGTDLKTYFKTNYPSTYTELGATSANAQGALTLNAVIKASGNTSQFKNGAANGGPTAQTAAASSSANALTLGGTGSIGLRGYLPEVIVFDRALSSSERMWIENYLRVKWGI